MSHKIIKHTDPKKFALALRDTILVSFESPTLSAHVHAIEGNDSKRSTQIDYFMQGEKGWQKFSSFISSVRCEVADDFIHQCKVFRIGN